MCVCTRVCMHACVCVYNKKCLEEIYVSLMSLMSLEVMYVSLSLSDCLMTVSEYETCVCMSVCVCVSLSDCLST